METEVQALQSVVDPAPANDPVMGLRETVAEAKEAIRAESEALDTKNKGGRPKGAKDKRPRVPYGSRKHLSVVPGTLASVQESQDETSQVSMLPAIEAVLKVPFDLAAGQTGCEALRVTSDEAKPSVEAIDQVIKLYFPEALEKNPKEMALISLALALGGLALAKFTAFTQWEIAQKTLVQNSDNGIKGNPTGPVAAVIEPTGGGRPAQDYFASASSSLRSMS